MPHVRFTVFSCLTLALLFASPASAEVVVLHAGDAARADTPVSIPWAGSGPVAAKNAATGASVPATLRGGELTLIVSKLEVGKTLRVEVTEHRTPGDAVQVTKRGGKNIVDIVINGEPFTSYHYEDGENKPFLWPVLSAGGVPVTRAWPMGEGVEGFKQDHPHHRSLYTAYGEVNDADFWLEGERADFQTVRKVTFGSGGAYGWVRSVILWETKDREPVLEEIREYRFYATAPERRFIDVLISFRAVPGDVHFGDTKEGGIVSVRVRPELSANGGSGIITNAHGDQGEKATWGKPSPWCDYSGPLPGIGWRGITIFDHPTNLRHPTSWHVRGYGLMGANCFGWSYFTSKEDNKPLLPGEDGSYVLAKGQTLNFKYRVYVHTGDVKEANVAARYADFAAPPAAVTQ